MNGERSQALARALSVARAARTTSATDDEDVIASAMLAGAIRHRNRTARRGAIASVGVLAAAAAALLWMHEPSASRQLSSVRLASGDQLTTVSGSEFAIESEARDRRKLRLTEGAMLFDVRPLGGNTSFEVETPDTSIRVLGTVFAVERNEHGTSVTVFEGQVEVRDRGGRRVLSAGQSNGSPGEGIARLRAAGQNAARQRTSVARAAKVLVPVNAPGAAAVSSTSLPAPLPSIPLPAPTRAAGTSAAPTRHELSLEEAHSYLTSGRAEEALAFSRRHVGREYRWLEGDALRALGRAEDAAQVYEELARSSSGIEQSRAAFTEANAWISAGTPRNALGALDRFELDARGAPLEERSLALRARALELSGEDIAPVARRYLERFPQGSRADWMRAHLGPASSE